MRAVIAISDLKLMSKQHSRGYAKTGRTFTRPEYARQRDALRMIAIQQLRRWNWYLPSEKDIKLIVRFKGRFDVDNAGGFVMDALQGAAYVRDSQVKSASFEKDNDLPGYLEINIEEIEQQGK